MARKRTPPPPDAVDDDYDDEPAEPPKASKGKSKRKVEAEALDQVKASIKSKPPARAAKAPAKRSTGRSRGRARSSRGGRWDRWKGWLALEALTVVGGVALGLCVTFGLMWARASRDVSAYLANPPRPVPSVVYSAPIEVRAGMAASVPALAGDLLAAGYERVPKVSEPAPDTVGQFALTEDGLDVWSTPWTGPTGKVAGGKVHLSIADGKVARASTPRVTLRPTVLGTLGDLETSRTRVTLDQVSEWVEPALLSMEDSRFREHSGVDPIGIVRAFVLNLTSDDVQGASTLTQQLAKNLFLTKERTLRRKVREVFFAAALESKLGKDALLELYLTEVYLGQMGGLPLYGVDAAARAWFGVSAEHLALDQAATLVGVIPAPNLYSPVRHPETALERRNVVLQKMASDGRIDEVTRAAAAARPLVLTGLEPSRIRRAPYAVDAAVDRAEEALGQGALASRGYAVYTAIQPLLQRAAEDAVAQGMAELDQAYPKAAGAQAALVAVRLDDGAVVAMVGGRSYADSAFNRARDAHRQAGSTVKPLTMLAAFDQGLANPATILEDQPISRTFDGVAWSPKNYDGEYAGEVSLREAIEGSRNIPMIHLAERIGLGPLQRFYRSAGLVDATHLPSAALGTFSATPMEMASAYTAFDSGVAHAPRVVLAITDPAGAPVLSFEDDAQSIASRPAAQLAVHVLEGVIANGTATRAASYGVGPPAAGKTGTTDDYRDAWFVGITGDYAIAVWVGRDEGTLGLSGSRAALPTWSRFVMATGMARGERPLPDGLITASLCAESAMPARDACPESYDEWFLRDDVPEEKCDEHGGPIVRTGRLFGRLFGKKRKVEDEDDR
ncbi:MAG: transglycosylase domain-containing protein [Myxococcota bacterium]